MSRRLPNWPHLLAAYIDATRSLVFAWGMHDCCTFAAGSVLAITGRMVPLPAWSGRRDAVATLRSLGGLPAATTAQLGAMRAPAHAQRGDVVLLRQRGRSLLGVCLGHVWAAPGAAGPAFGPLGAALGAWKV